MFVDYKANQKLTSLVCVTLQKIDLYISKIATFGQILVGYLQVQSMSTSVSKTTCFYNFSTYQLVIEKQNLLAKIFELNISWLLKTSFTCKIFFNISWLFGNKSL